MIAPVENIHFVEAGKHQQNLFPGWWFCWNRDRDQATHSLQKKQETKVIRKYDLPSWTKLILFALFFSVSPFLNMVCSAAWRRNRNANLFRTITSFFSSPVAEWGMWWCRRGSHSIAEPEPSCCVSLLK